MVLGIQQFTKAFSHKNSNMYNPFENMLQEENKKIYFHSLVSFQPLMTVASSSF